MTRLSDTILNAWQKILDRFEGRRLKVLALAKEEDVYLQARLMARAGDLQGAVASYERAADMAPDFFEAVESHGEMLDMIGQSSLAVAKYDAVRMVRQKLRPGAPDRTFVLRRSGRFSAEIAAYSSVLKSMKQRVLPFVARGNALLASGRPEPALIDYESALLLKPGLPEVLAMKGEALSMMTHYEDAIAFFTASLAAHPGEPEVLSGRAIAYMALGRIELADADWRLQFERLPRDRASARACVALRLGDYAAALPELERALEKEPGDPYWQLYRMTTLARLGKPTGAVASASDGAWPGPLLALHAGGLSAEQVFEKADTGERRVEALFQLGILALPADLAQARRHFEEVVEKSAPSQIEYAAARHELARLGS